jgi:sirohydrochlorin ferrochelatase
MRHPRLTPVGQAAFRGDSVADPAARADSPPLIAVAHGSKDPRAAATVSELLAAVRALSPGLDVRAAFLDHCAPALGQVLGSVDGGSAVVVPLLLTAAFHSKTDIPAQLAAAAAAHPGQQRQDVVSADTLGPHPLLLRALERRLAEAGVPVGDPAARAATSVVLAAAGSSDPAANATVAALAERWTRERGWRAVVPGYASAAAPAPAEAVRALRAGGQQNVVVATYLLSPGYFADKIAAGAAAAGASAVSPVLGAAPEVAEVVLGRYAAARRIEAAARAQSFASTGRSQDSARRIVTSRLGNCFTGGN